MVQYVAGPERLCRVELHDYLCFDGLLFERQGAPTTILKDLEVLLLTNSQVV